MTGTETSRARLAVDSTFTPAHHPVTADVGEYERLHPVALEMPGKIDEIVVGQLRPPVDGEASVPCIEADDDVSGKLDAEVGNEVRRRDRLGSQDDELHAGLDVRLHRLLVADAAPDLDRYVGMCLDDVMDDPGVLRLTGERSVEVDDMKPAGAGLDPACRYRDRVVGEHGRRVHAPFAQAHALAILDVDGGNEKHLVRVAGIAGDAPGVRSLSLAADTNQVLAKVPDAISDMSGADIRPDFQGSASALPGRPGLHIEPRLREMAVDGPGVVPSEPNRAN